MKKSELKKIIREVIREAKYSNYFNVSVTFKLGKKIEIDKMRQIGKKHHLQQANEGSTGPNRWMSWKVETKSEAISFARELQSEFEGQAAVSVLNWKEDKYTEVNI